MIPELYGEMYENVAKSSSARNAIDWKLKKNFSSKI